MWLWSVFAGNKWPPRLHNHAFFSFSVQPPKHTQKLKKFRHTPNVIYEIVEVVLGGALEGRSACSRGKEGTTSHHDGTCVDLDKCPLFSNLFSVFAFLAKMQLNLELPSRCILNSTIFPTKFVCIHKFEYFGYLSLTSALISSTSSRKNSKSTLGG